ncbi:MAG TPA: DUF1573 domain-containing protein [Planctomycetaceae bacterium]|jgi:hypothetical protein|nr:DUF1573 domain-containing protein [Planctomycetaceae bacterium]
MFSPSHRRVLLFLPIVLLCATSARAQNWAEPMFDSLSHDFGAVAKDAEVVHRFRVKNVYQQDVRIASVTTSCGCTTPKFDPTPVKSGDSTYVEISIDTHKFSGQKSPTITVTFDQPQPATVRIPVKINIRSDLVLTPGSINFGAVEVGTKLERKLEVDYAGRPDWKILNVVTKNKYLEARVVETSRTGINVNYDLIVSLLPDAPAGTIHQQIDLLTDDATAPQIPVLVHARVEGDMLVSPSVVQLGSMAPGAESSKTVLIRGYKPFVIDKIAGESVPPAFKMPKLTKESKTVHVLSFTFIAPKETGAFTQKFVVTVAGRPEPITFTARGTIETAQH